MHLNLIRWVKFHSNHHRVVFDEASRTQNLGTCPLDGGGPSVLAGLLGPLISQSSTPIDQPLKFLDGWYGIGLGTSLWHQKWDRDLRSQLATVWDDSVLAWMPRTHSWAASIFDAHLIQIPPKENPSQVKCHLSSRRQSRYPMDHSYALHTTYLLNRLRVRVTHKYHSV